MTGRLKNIIIIVLLVVVALVGLYNIIDLKAAYLKVQEQFEEERNSDSVKHAELLLRDDLKDLRAEISSYEDQLESQRIELSVEQAALNKSLDLKDKRNTTKVDFAQRIVASVDEPFEYFGQNYSPEAAREQLRYFIVLVQDMESDIIEKRTRVDSRSAIIKELEHAISMLKQQMADTEKEAERLIAAKQLSEIQKLSNDLAGIRNGVASSSSLSKITGDINHLFGLLEQEIARNSYLPNEGSSLVASGGTKVLGFEEAEAMQDMQSREAAIDSELSELLGQ